MKYAIFANVGTDGVIVFAPNADTGLERLPVGQATSAEASMFREVVSALARHSRDGAHLLVPGVPEASSQSEAVDALIVFRSRIDETMASRRGR